MDGSSKSTFVNGRLFRPATLSQALERYPNIILLFALGKLSVLRDKVAEGAQTVRLAPSFVTGAFPISIPSSDFQKIENIAKALVSQCVLKDIDGVLKFEFVSIASFRQVKIYPTEPFSDVIGKIKAYIMVTF